MAVVEISDYSPDPHTPRAPCLADIGHARRPFSGLKGSTPCAWSWRPHPQIIIESYRYRSGDIWAEHGSIMLQGTGYRELKMLLPC